MKTYKYKYNANDSSVTGFIDADSWEEAHNELIRIVNKDKSMERCIDRSNAIIGSKITEVEQLSEDPIIKMLDILEGKHKKKNDLLPWIAIFFLGVCVGLGVAYTIVMLCVTLHPTIE